MVNLLSEESLQEDTSTAREEELNSAERRYSTPTAYTGSPLLDSIIAPISGRNDSAVPKENTAVHMAIRTSCHGDQRTPEEKPAHVSGHLSESIEVSFFCCKVV